MSSGGGNNDVTEYERKRMANVERNKRRLEALKIPRLDNMARQVRQKRVSKKIPATSNATTEPHNLRPRPQRTNAEERNNAAIQACEDFLAENEDVHNGNQINNPKKRKGRGITRKEDIFSRTPKMPKLKVLLNARGQPVGKNGRKLSSVVGCQVRKKLSVGSLDWRLVDAQKKDDLWTDIQEFYELDDAAYNWFMRTAGRKWKEFKAKLKTKYFKPNVEYTDEEISKSRDNRVNDADWKFLFTYWMSPESLARAEKAKASRAQLQVPHTAGSVSYACSEHDLELELGRPPRRDENYIKTHTRKDGVPSKQNQLKEIIEAHPELRERTIQEGDAFAAVCGPKEPKGRVRVLGLGPTPQDVGTPGLKCYMATRLQMEIFARKKVETEKVALEKRVDELLARMDRMEQRTQQDRSSVEPTSQNGSTSRLNANARLQQICDEPEQDDGEEDYCSGDDECYNEDNEEPDEQDVACSEHDARVGKDVILFAMLRNQPVAKGTIIATKPTTIVENHAIGSEFCEVIVTHVLKSDAILPRPYTGVEKMGDAKMMSIAWPYERLKVCDKKSTPPASGCLGRRG